jgi:hypothetical protein
MRTSSFALPLAAAALLGATAFGCVSAVEERSTTPSWSPPAPADAPATTRPGPTAPANPAPEIVFEQIEGAEPARVRAAFAPVRERLGECRPGSNGVIRLRLVRDKDTAKYSVQPSTTLDPRRRTCVLETLSTVDVDGISGNASPSARTPAFTAQFRFEW